MNVIFVDRTCFWKWNASNDSFEASFCSIKSTQKKSKSIFIWIFYCEKLWKIWKFLNDQFRSQNESKFEPQSLAKNRKKTIWELANRKMPNIKWQQSVSCWQVLLRKFSKKKRWNYFGFFLGSEKRFVTLEMISWMRTAPKLRLINIHEKKLSRIFCIEMKRWLKDDKSEASGDVFFLKMDFCRKRV